MRARWGTSVADDGDAEEEETDSFSPANVPSIGFPAWYKSPGSPLVADGDSDAHS